MSPRFKVQVPAIALGSGLPMSTQRKLSAESATEFLMDSRVIDWLGNARILRDVTDQTGNTHEIEFATRQLFLALVAEGITYRDYREKIIRNPGLVGEDAKRAVEYCHHVFTKSSELQSLKLGDGAILLARMNRYIEQQIEKDKIAQGHTLQ